jgi:hypothetical protein
MSGNAARNGYRWAITGAFAGQAALLLAIAALLTMTTGRPAAAPSSGTISYALSMDGQTGSATVTHDVPVPTLSYKVGPAETVYVTLTLTVPAGLPPAAQVTDLQVSLYNREEGGVVKLYHVFNAATAPLAPGKHTFTVTFAGPLGPNQWLYLYMTTDGWGPAQWAIANIITAPCPAGEQTVYTQQPFTGTCA